MKTRNAILSPFNKNERFIETFVQNRTVAPHVFVICLGIIGYYRESNLPGCTIVFDSLKRAGSWESFALNHTTLLHCL